MSLQYSLQTNSKKEVRLAITADESWDSHLFSVISFLDKIGVVRECRFKEGDNIHSAYIFLSPEQAAKYEALGHPDNLIKNVNYPA